MTSRDLHLATRSANLKHNKELEASYRFCVSVAKREAKNFYPSFRLLSRDRRLSMCALYAFLRRTDDIVDEHGAPGLKREALTQWRLQLHDACAGKPPTKLWEGWLALSDTISRHAIPARYLDLVIYGVEMDLDPKPFATFEELHGYCYQVASAVGLSCLHIWGFDSNDGEAESLAVTCGLALQLTNIIRDVGEDARNGRIYLPSNDMREFGVSPDDLLAKTTSPALRRLLAFEGQRAYAYYEHARPLDRFVDPEGRPVLRAIVGIYRALLDAIQFREYDVLKSRISVPTWHKGAITLWAYAGLFYSRDTQSKGSRSLR